MQECENNIIPYILFLYNIEVGMDNKIRNIGRGKIRSTITGQRIWRLGITDCSGTCTWWEVDMYLHVPPVCLPTRE